MPAEPTGDYVELLKRAVLGNLVGLTVVHQKPPRPPNPALRWLARRAGLTLTKAIPVDMSDNDEGRRSVWILPDWPMTMIGRTRLDNVDACIRDVVANEVPGDVIEAGVWRGGTGIFMAGLLRALGETDRHVFVADSFEGLPAPDVEKYPADEGIVLHLWPGLAVPLEEVRGNFERYGLLDDNVHFVKGWFRDTLPRLRGHRWSVVRLDGDLYESTMDALTNLYPDLSPGGWLIIDDHEIPACAQAVADYRKQHGINDEMVEVDWTGVCWRKSK